MLIVPAIDLLDGRCVQLQQGDFERARRYGDDAPAVATGFAEQGALWIHVVDLDAARGDGGNRAAIGRIRKAVDVRVQVGGGVRTAEDAEALLDLGADAVVVGTTLATSTAEVLHWAERWPGRVVGGIDARLGQVQVKGWAESAGGERALIDAVRGSGLAGLIHTAVDRDGMLAGPDLGGGTAAAQASGLPVLFSGGVSSQADLTAIASTGAAAGAIVGTAIYERRVDLRQALGALQRPGDAGRWVT
ncbi:MAG: 1-(5-phosphoribosyl)-5-[(5-phosphoribosylamino)methylideneamino] imidazole-4-carboxamide isomerase [Spirochaetaceae bacterium]|nr:1-(5-phosphoribosyl)-5-[(5-phosphoribosylamino)methylideneamino] imidazole-4-carboxamide isomerase [Spirochaetaceae bacterium]